MSFRAPRDSTQARASAVATANAPQSPSITSVSVLSTAGPSMLIDEATEWVLFSPQMASVPSETLESIEPLEALEPLDSMNSRDEGSYAASGLAYNAIEAAHGAPDQQVPGGTLELPSHDGAGSFFGPSLEASDTTMRHNDQVERINMWRLDQSRLLFSELQRLERRLFYSHSPEESYDQNAATGVASDDMYTHNRSNRSRSASKLWRWLSRKSIEYLTLDGDVLDAILAEDYIVRNTDPTLDKAIVDDENSHFEHAKKAGPAHWDDDLVSRLIGDSAPEVSSLLKKLLALLPTHEPRMHQARAAFRHHLAVPSIESPLRNPYVRARRDGSYWMSDFDTTTSSVVTAY